MCAHKKTDEVRWAPPDADGKVSEFLEANSIVCTIPVRRPPPASPVDSAIAGRIKRQPQPQPQQQQQQQQSMMETSETITNPLTLDLTSPAAAPVRCPPPSSELPVDSAVAGRTKRQPPQQLQQQPQPQQQQQQQQQQSMMETSEILTNPLPLDLTSPAAAPVRRLPPALPVALSGPAGPFDRLPDHCRNDALEFASILEADIVGGTVAFSDAVAEGTGRELTVDSVVAGRTKRQPPQQPQPPPQQQQPQPQQQQQQQQSMMETSEILTNPLPLDLTSPSAAPVQRLPPALPVALAGPAAFWRWRNQNIVKNL
eukprot:SAG31_NODE_2969_length_4839_cov_2.768987_3_plen_313_part_00